jgi:damage-control phosphatase, subfamily II, stand-alone protein
VNSDVSKRSPFIKLADPSTYVACSWDLAIDHVGRDYWVDFFIKHLETLLALGVAAAARQGEALVKVQARAEACRADFVPRFRDFQMKPNGSGRVTILTLDEWRDAILRRHGFIDPMIDLKSNENEKVIGLLPDVCRELDTHDPDDQVLTMIKGVFAGNLFDMGAKASAKMYADGAGPSFFETRGNLVDRPWLIDDFDAMAAKFGAHKHKKAVYFIDNAGSDFLLGATPMIRWLAMRGTSVIIAANERPTLNDMTVHDVRHWWPRMVEAEPSLATLPIDIVSTGTGEPLIDLSLVSDELNAAAAEADLVIIEGMGRGVESNLDAAFSCDALNLAMIKDESIARRNGGKVFDCVCRFR